MVRVGVIKVSESEADHPIIAFKLSKLLQVQEWQIIKEVVIDNNHERLAEQMVEWADSKSIDIILTIGGIGFLKSDCVPEATQEIADRMVPGVAEALRYYSLQEMPCVVLSRGVAVIRRNTLIINLPNDSISTIKGLEAILNSLMCGVQILKGEIKECSRW